MKTKLVEQPYLVKFTVQHTNLRIKRKIFLMIKASNSSEACKKARKYYINNFTSDYIIIQDFTTEEFKHDCMFITYITEEY